MALSFQSNDGDRVSDHSPWSRFFREGAKLRDLLRVLDFIYIIMCDIARATVLLHYYRFGRTAAQAHHQFKKVHDWEALFCKTWCRWFKKFDSGDHKLKDLPRSGVPVLHIRAKIFQAAQANPKNGVRKWSADTDASMDTVRRTLHGNGKSCKRPRVVSHDLTPVQLKNQVDTCTLLLDLALNTQ